MSSPRPAPEPTTGQSGFTGFPEAAYDFYDDLELDNTRSFWTAHRGVYDTAVRQPMLALTQALEDEFGPAKVFRPYRDVRFAKDKTPYKNHQGAYVGVGPRTGWYVEVGSPGVRVAAGCYGADSTLLAAFREAVDDERAGGRLQRLLAGLERSGWGRGGDRLKTSPRGYPAGHPRIDLLRHRTLTMGRSYGFDPAVHTPALVDRVRGDWREARPLLEWFAAHVLSAGRP